MNILGLLDSLSRDLRRAVRALLQRPAFTATGVLTLALGIGATTAIFSVVYSVLIMPLPYANANELVSVSHAAPGVEIADDLGEDRPMYLTYRDENRTFAEIGLWQETSATLTEGGEAERLSAVSVSGGTLPALGIQPLSGRSFAEQEHGPLEDGPGSVILSHAFWQQRFGGDEAVLGRELSIDSQPSQVVGIMPPQFRFLDMAPQPDVILAMRLDPADATIGGYSFSTLGRLRPGVTPAEARADLERLLPIYFDAWPVASALRKEELENWRITPIVRPLRDKLVGDIEVALWTLMGAIGAVLLIACANIANLMLVRAEARQQEFAVRSALGAAPARIAAELLIESLVLGVVSSLLGLALAHLGLQALVALGPSELPRLEEIAIHPPALGLVAVLALVSTLLIGAISTARYALQVDKSLLGTTRAATATGARNMTRSALVIVQVALALVLVVSAALFIRTAQTLRNVDPGFSDPATIQTARIWIPATLFSDAQRFTGIQHEILDRIQSLPGVISSSFTSQLPMEGMYSNNTVIVEGQVPAAGEAPPLRRWIYVAPGYFASIGTRLIAGRDLTWSDIEAGGRVVVVSEDFAREIAGEAADALGRRVRAPIDDSAWREVIGVVQNVRQDGLYEEPPKTVYWPVHWENRFGSPYVAFVIRSELAGSASLMREVRQAVRAVNRDIPITLEGTMRDLYSESLARTSFTLVMLAIAGGMALTLGIVGIYGVIAYIVSQRRREIGIRSALGAQPRQLKRIFLVHGLRLSAVGIVIGLIAAMVLARSISSLLFGVAPLDPSAFAAGIIVIFAAAALASYLPARRAAAVDPIETLGTE